MTAVEVCPICDIAGCRHIRDRKAMTGEEPNMDGLIERLRYWKDGAVNILSREDREQAAAIRSQP